MKAMAKANVKTFMFEKDQIEDITKILDRGGLILYPTDTIWGIGCDATNLEAVDNVFALKKRDRNKSMVLLVSSLEMLKRYVRHVHPRIDTLLLHHRRPLTIVFDEAMNLPEGVMADDGSIAIRIVQDEFCQELIESFGKPLIATSANISNAPYPANFGEISSDVIRNIDYVVKHRRHEKTLGEPSVIVKVVNDGEMIFLRE